MSHAQLIKPKLTSQAISLRVTDDEMPKSFSSFLFTPPNSKLVSLSNENPQSSRPDLYLCWNVICIIFIRTSIPNSDWFSLILNAWKLGRLPSESICCCSSFHFAVPSGRFDNHHQSWAQIVCINALARILTHQTYTHIHALFLCSITKIHQ